MVTMPFELCPRCERLRRECRSKESCDAELEDEEAEAQEAIRRAEDSLSEAEDWLASLSPRRVQSWCPPHREEEDA